MRRDYSVAITVADVGPAPAVWGPYLALAPVAVVVVCAIVIIKERRAHERKIAETTVMPKGEIAGAVEVVESVAENTAASEGCTGKAIPLMHIDETTALRGEAATAHANGVAIVHIAEAFVVQSNETATARAAKASTMHATKATTMHAPTEASAVHTSAEPSAVHAAAEPPTTETAATVECHGRRCNNEHRAKRDRGKATDEFALHDFDPP
jgi:hypothetical protein